MNSMIILLILIILVGGCSNNVIHYAGWTSVGNFAQTEIDSINQVPHFISEKTIDHLIQKIGRSNLDLFTFVRGEKIDLLRIERLQDFNWQVYNYRLIFKFCLPERGLTAYEFDVQLDSIGNLLKEIELPNIKNDSKKIEIIGVATVKDIADKNNFRFDKIDFDYIKELDSFVWVFENQTHTHTNWLYIDANNGDVVKSVSSEIIY